MSPFILGALMMGALVLFVYSVLPSIQGMLLYAKDAYRRARRRREFLKPRELTKRDFFWLGWSPTHQHKKGGLYEEAMRGIATDPIEEGETVVAYVHETGSIYFRPARLFDEPERFKELEA